MKSFPLIHALLKAIACSFSQYFSAIHLEVVSCLFVLILIFFNVVAGDTCLLRSEKRSLEGRSVTWRNSPCDLPAGAVGGLDPPGMRGLVTSGSLQIPTMGSYTIATLQMAISFSTE